MAEYLQHGDWVQARGSGEWIGRVRQVRANGQYAMVRWVRVGSREHPPQYYKHREVTTVAAIRDLRQISLTSPYDEDG